MLATRVVKIHCHHHVVTRALDPADGAGAKDAMTIRIVCSRGTYIRTLAADIGQFLGCGAFLSRLTRIRNGFFSIEECLSGEVLFRKEADRDLLLQSLMPVEKVEKLLV